MSAEIRPVIKDYILQEFLPGEDESQLTETTPLITGGVLDSVATLRLLLFLEERFDVKLEAHETGREYMDTIATIADLVDSKKAQSKKS
jgi:acyl carrier protein